MTETPIDDARRWEIFMLSADKGGSTDEVLNRALRLVKVGADFMDVSGWMMTEWGEELVPFRVHVEKIVSVNDGRGDVNGQPGLAVIEMPDNEGNQRESYHRVGSLQNVAYRKVLADARRFMEQGASVVLHCGYEPNTTGWTTIVNGAKVTPPHLKRVFHIEKRGGQPAAQQPAAVAPAQQPTPAPQAPAAPAEPQPAPAAAPVAATAAPTPMADSVADLEARLAAAQAAQQGAQEVPVAPPATATSSSDAALPTDEEWQQLYSKKLKMAQRRELNQRATAEGWEGHNPGAANMLKAFTAICEYLTEEEIASVLSPAAAA